MKVQSAASAEYTAAEGRIWNKTFTSLFIANMLMYLGHQMCNTLVAKYADYLGADTVIVGFVSSSYAITALLFKLVSAPAIDSLNRKRILFCAMCVMSAALAGYSLAGSIPVLMASRLLQGVGQAFTATCCLVMASDSLPKNRLAQGISYFSLAQATCQAIGPTIGLTLVSKVGYHFTFGLGSLCIFCGALCVLGVHYTGSPKSRFHFSLSGIIAKEAVLPAAVMFCVTVAFCNTNSFLVLYAEELGVENIGYFFTVYAFALYFRPLMGRLVDRYGMIRVMVPAMLAFAFSFFLISIARSLPLFLLAGLISAFGYGSCLPTVQALSMRLVGAERRGAASCTTYIGQDLANFAGPAAAGAIIGVFGYSMMWRIMTIPIFCGIVIVIFARKTFR